MQLCLFTVIDHSKFTVIDSLEHTYHMFATQHPG